jgi:hypothetical protein
MNERMDRMWTAAYRSELPAQVRGKALPICLLGAGSRSYTDSDNGFKQMVLKWYRTHKPDAIITPTIPVFEWLTEEGYSMPKDVAVISMSLQEEDRTPGIVEASLEIGAAAGDFLVGMLQRGEYGVPATAQRVLLEGKWFSAKLPK